MLFGISKILKVYRVFEWLLACYVLKNTSLIKKTFIDKFSESRYSVTKNKVVYENG